MRRPTILSGIALACAIGLLALATESFLYYRYSSTVFLRGTLIACQFLYCLYLLRSIRPRIGVLTMALFQAVLGAGLFLLPVSDGWFLIAWALGASLTRILLLRRSLVTAGLDIASALAGVLFFHYLLTNSGSLSQAVWGFFLTQAATSLIPARIRKSNSGESIPADPFQASLRQARNAIEELQ